MKLISLFFLTAGALMLAGCSTPDKIDSGAIRASTFSFINPGPGRTPVYADKAPAVHAKIQEAITKHLASVGVTKVESGGDITVGYLLIIGDNASTTSINDYFGDRGDELVGLEDKAHSAYTGSKNPNFFEAGTLVIDLIDSKSYKVLSRGHATRPLLQNATDEVRTARIQEVVDEIFSNLKIAR